MGNFHRGCTSWLKHFTIPVDYLCFSSRKMEISLSFITINTISGFFRGNTRKPSCFELHIRFRLDDGNHCLERFALKDLVSITVYMALRRISV